MRIQRMLLLHTHTRKVQVLSDGTRNILKAMESTGVKRLICMSSAGILGNDAGFWFGKIFMPLFLNHIFADKLRQADVIRESSADWVIIRPTGLTDAPKTNTIVERVVWRDVVAPPYADAVNVIAPRPAANRGLNERKHPNREEELVLLPLLDLALQSPLRTL